MDTHKYVWRICHAYLDDCRAELDDHIYNTLHGAIRARNVAVLANAMLLYDPVYHGSQVCRHLRQLAAFLKKNAVFSDDLKCSIAAKNSFIEWELHCAKVNRDLASIYVERGSLSPDFNSKIDKMELFIKRVLGSYDRFIEVLPSLVRVTSGATSTLPRRKALPHMKVRGRVLCSKGAQPFVLALSKLFGYDFVKTRVSPFNRVEFVPKNWKTHRTIACEPEGNMPFQLAFDTYVKDRLRRKTKVNLRSQFRNQRLALQGSCDGRVATVDLSAASDTLAYETVRWLLPDDWFSYVDALRSAFYYFPREDSTRAIGKYEKFSSMGNGTTFVLETLVFAAASHAVGDATQCVYGDDIVVDSEKYADLVELLAFFGFVVNQDKSYHTGPFRESCGKDYCSGIDVTPFYVRDWSERLEVFHHNINGLAGIAYPGGSLEDLLISFLHEHKNSSKSKKKSKQFLFVPHMESTIAGIHICASEAYNRRLIRSEYSRHKVRALQPKAPTKAVVDSRTLLLWHLEAIGRGPSPYTKIIRSRVPLGYIRYVLRRIFWRVPEVATPDHLYWWSDRLASEGLLPPE